MQDAGRQQEKPRWWTRRELTDGGVGDGRLLRLTRRCCHFEPHHCGEVSAEPP